MEFEHTLPEWKNEGKEPTDALKTSGFQKGDRPAATIFNWFWATTAKAITELQSKVSTISGSSGGGMVGTEEEMNDNYIPDPDIYYMDNCTVALSTTDEGKTKLTMTPIDTTKRMYCYFYLDTSLKSTSTVLYSNSLSTASGGIAMNISGGEPTDYINGLPSGVVTFNNTADYHSTGGYHETSGSLTINGESSSYYMFGVGNTSIDFNTTAAEDGTMTTKVSATKDSYTLESDNFVFTNNVNPQDGLACIYVNTHDLYDESTSESTLFPLSDPVTVTIDGKITLCDGMTLGEAVDEVIEYVPEASSIAVDCSVGLSNDNKTATLIPDHDYNTEARVYAFLNHSGVEIENNESFTLTLSGQSANLGLLSLYWGDESYPITEELTSKPDPTKTLFAIHTTDSENYTVYVNGTAQAPAGYSNTTFTFQKYGDGAYWDISYTGADGSEKFAGLNLSTTQTLFSGSVLLWSEATPSMGSQLELSATTSSGTWSL